ncbi:MAG: rhomboid family intramembrane serine protease [Pseudonocardiaceae bacterium]|nr:rhomboid family intramembrane serine protease [Pseudonocardiaceae bacterium]
MPACTWHADRATGLTCTRCDRPACPECLREASVGYQCVECVRASQREQHRATTVAGATLGSKAIVVPALIVANLVVFAITAAQASDVLENFRSPLFGQWTLWPPIVAGGEWWRVLTSGFLHYGPLHLAMNMLALWILGRDIELLLGRLRFFALYALSLIGGGLAVYLFGAMDTPVAGASGAVFGLMGGLVVAVLRLKLNGTQVYVLLAVNLIISVGIPGISLLGHLGGLIVGALCTVGMVFAPPRRRAVVQWGTVAGLLVLLVALFFVRDAQLGEFQCPTNQTCYPVSGSGGIGA